MGRSKQVLAVLKAFFVDSRPAGAADGPPGKEMMALAILEIRKIGDPVLEQKAASVEKTGEEIRRLVNDMLDTMREARGIGLAGPQVGVSKRVVVIEIENRVLIMLNPEILSKSGKDRAVEGCLSIPGIEGEVERASRIRVRFTDENGNEHEQDEEGLMARCMQHEIDHLEGKLFTMRLGTARRLQLKKRLSQMRKETRERLRMVG